MKRILFNITCMLMLSAQVIAQSYDAGLIPKTLLPYASSVIRNQEVKIEVKGLDNTVYHIKQAVTILNKNGDDMANVVVWHNKSNIIKNIKGVVYNSAGIQTGKFSESDFEDVNTDDGFSLFQDIKIKHYQPSVTDYPYTVEYEYEVRSKQSLIFEDWQPDPGTATSVEKSTFTFTCKPDFNIRYKEFNLNSPVSISTDKSGMKIYAWQVNDIKAIRHEPYDPDPEKYLSMVKIAPEKFEYEGIGGSFTNWNELGKWIYDKLLVNRQTISPATTQHIIDITKDISDPKLKAKKIYEYMQDKTHYVSVQIGIGGYQPFLASDVDQLNYGDCKALVNYTQALLQAVNINSYYCVVMANPNRKVSLLSDFASMDQANHIILCIPFKNDTTWADCTSQTIPFGYLGDFTDDRTVLACTPDGGKLLRTPKYTAADNLQQRKADFQLNDEGVISGVMTTTFHGVEYTDREGVISESPKDQLKIMQRIYAINNMDIEKLEFKQDKTLQPVTTETLKLQAPEYASVNDGRINFLVNPVNRLTHAPGDIINRALDVYINEGYTDDDEITYALPANYKPGTTPLNIEVNKPFGSFTATTTVTGNKLIYKRKLKIIDGTYPKAMYRDVVDFYQAVVDADTYDVTLIKSN